MYRAYFTPFYAIADTFEILVAILVIVEYKMQRRVIYIPVTHNLVCGGFKIVGTFYVPVFKSFRHIC
jgi:hypothetical protein